MTLKAVRAGYQPDFIISDYRLPDGNGADLIVQLRAELGVDVPGFLLTGDTKLDATHRRGLDALHKPLSAKALKEALNKPERNQPR